MLYLPLLIGGTASNLVALIAQGDVALSVAMTSVSTLMAAAVTGPLTKLLVGALVDINAATLVRTTAQARKKKAETVCLVERWLGGKGRGSVVQP